MLFFRECKKVILSIPFLILIFAMAAMAVSQDAMDFSKEKIEKPTPGGQYGFHTKKTPEVIIPAALKSLSSEHDENSYTTYPMGFLKKVRLDDNSQKKIGEILNSLTRKPVSELSYSGFEEKMLEVSELIGEGSAYAPDALIKFGVVPITYEEALKQYELSVNVDRYTGGYARFFMDYMLAGVLCLLPVFPAVAVCLKDRRSHMEELICSVKMSSVRIVLTRYLAIVGTAMLALIVLAYISNMSVWKLYSGHTLDYLAPLKYALLMGLPSVMICVSVGMFFTELTGTPAAIAVQGLWWFLDINLGMGTDQSGYPLYRLIPRHNSAKQTQEFLDHFQSLAVNRLFMAGLAVLLLAASIYIFEQKRRGRLHGKGGIKKLSSFMASRRLQPEA